MRPWIAGAFVALVLCGCGNRESLPQESGGDFIPFKNYFVYAEWENIGRITDIAVTNAQWLYFAEDSATVKRYRRKGRNVEGSIVASVIETLPGLERPVALDEGAEDNLWILDLTAGFPEDTAKVRRYNILDDIYTAAWQDTAWGWANWLFLETTFRTIRQFREVELTALAADDEDNVFVAGNNFRWREVINTEFDTIFSDEFPDAIDSLIEIGFDTTYRDTNITWFVRTYDQRGEFLYEAVGSGTGVGFSEGITDAALTSDLLVYADTMRNQVKANDPAGEHLGIDWLTGEEATDPGENIPFVLQPGGIAGDPAGFFYISDTGNGRIVKYDSDLRYVLRVDQNAPGIATAPTEIGVTDSLVYVFDDLNTKLVLFEFPRAEDPAQ